MKIPKSTFISAVAPLVKISSKRTTLPILSTLLLSSSGKQLTVRATDLDLDATEVLECDGELEPACVNADRFFNHCRSAAEALDLEKVDARLRVKLKQDDSALFGILDVATFPPVRTAKTTAIGVNSVDLARAMRAVEFACCRDSQDHPEGRPFLSCVTVVGSNNEIKTYAFNKVILAHSSVKAITTDFSFMLRHNHVGPICDALLRDGAQLHLCDKFVLVKYDTGSLSAPLVNAPPPEWNNILGLPFEDVGKIPREPILDAAKICKGFADSLNDKIELSFGERLRIATRFSDAYKTEVESENRVLQVFVGAGFLTECLSAFDCPALEMADAHQKIRLRGGDLTVVLSTMRED